jgi:signal transduction histidine kinase/integral membrane sensor domain MASE1
VLRWDPVIRGNHWAEAEGTPSALHVATAGLAVCVGYFIGANIGFILRLPPATPSILWPPNSILTATLLLAPPRRWWIYLLAALPAHLVVELPVLSPPSLVFALYASNCLEAVIGAAAVRALSDAPARFDTLPRVAAFVVGAGILGPFLSSFADAAVVTMLVGEPYVAVWRTRFFSNMLTELILVPAIVFLVRSGWNRMRRASPARRLEAVLLAMAVGAVAVLYVLNPAGGSTGMLGAPHTPVAFFVPFVLWGTVRFGPAGAALTMLVTTLIVVWAATHGHAGFSMPPSPESVLVLQVSLSLSAIPILGLAGLIEERWRDRLALADRLRFEELLARLSGGFVHLPSNQMDENFETWLERLGRFFDLDRMVLLRLSEDGLLFAVESSWTTPGRPPVPRTNVSAAFPWIVGRLLREQSVIFERPAELPRDAVRDRESLHADGITSKLALPLVAGGRVLGGLAFVTLGREQAWPDELVGRLQLVAEVFANALGRKESEDALRASELMKSAILASLNSSVAVLDGAGQVIAVNRLWARFAPDFNAASSEQIGVGDNYLGVCREATRRGEPHAGDALIGIESVLDGSRAGFSFEYPAGTATGERWYAMSVVPLNRPEGGAVVSSTDITERKRAELEAQRSRQELAHFTRVSTMGELTASLAHELYQPLTGILTNAQAARRLLDVAKPDLAELRAILSDIVEDDRRAADVIQRLRDLLRKGESEVSRLDLNALVRDVLKLLSSDTVIRNVSIALDLDSGPTVISGDRVQIEQVLLNLLLNAMEAMAERIGGDRTVVVRTRKAEGDSVQASVEDGGPGIRAGTHQMVFEPFYTTKASGMGMGLAIARSIIEAHGGTIWAENNSRGATFHFRLPLCTGVSG